MSLDDFLGLGPDEEMRKALRAYERDGNPFAGSKIDFEVLMENLEATISQHPELWWSRSLTCSACGFDEVIGWSEDSGYFCATHGPGPRPGHLYAGFKMYWWQDPSSWLRAGRREAVPAAGAPDLRDHDLSPA